MPELMSPAQQQSTPTPFSTLIVVFRMSDRSSGRTRAISTELRPGLQLFIVEHETMSLILLSCYHGLLTPKGGSPKPKQSKVTSSALLRKTMCHDSCMTRAATWQKITVEKEASSRLGLYVVWWL